MGDDFYNNDYLTRNYGTAMVPLDELYEPSSNDVMVGRGKACRLWVGNEKFRELVASKLGDYSAATSKLEKSAIVAGILQDVRKRSPKGGFIKKDTATGRWHEVGDFIARERITQSFRDALHDSYRSSNQSKKKRRKELLKKAKESNEPKVKKGKLTNESASVSTELTTVSSHIHTSNPLSPGFQRDSLPMPSSLDQEFQHTLPFPQKSADSTSSQPSGFPSSSGQLGPFPQIPSQDTFFQNSFVKQHSYINRQASMARRTADVPSEGQYPSFLGGQTLNHGSIYPNNWFTVGTDRRFSWAAAPSSGFSSQAPPGLPSVINTPQQGPSSTLTTQNNNENQQSTMFGFPPHMEAFVTASNFASALSSLHHQTQEDNPFEPTPIADDFFQPWRSGTDTNSTQF